MLCGAAESRPTLPSPCPHVHAHTRSSQAGVSAIVAQELNVIINSIIIIVVVVVVVAAAAAVIILFVLLLLWALKSTI